MASRSIGKFTINIGMVSLPVSAYVAVEDPGSAVSMRLLHRECGTPHQQKKYCPKCEKHIEQSDLVKGYELDDGKFVRFEQQELDDIQPESTSNIAVTFVPEDKIDPIFYRHSYYLRPQDVNSAHSFVYMREAMKGFVAIGTWTSSGREHLIGIRPFGQLLAMHLLHTHDEVRAMETTGGLGLVEGVVIEKRQLGLAKSVVEAFKDEDLDFEQFEDSYKADFLQLLEAKVAGQAVTKTQAKKAPGAPLDFMAQLEKSLTAQKPAKRKKVMAKAEPAKKQKKAS
jgi:DNA end-binding protein Ku